MASTRACRELTRRTGGTRSGASAAESARPGAAAGTAAPSQDVDGLALRHSLGIPAEYWIGGGLLLFLTALEKKFNVVQRINTERAEQAAARAEARAREREAEVREAMAERELAHLREGMSHVERQVEGLDETPASFQLRSGELVVEGEPDEVDAAVLEP